MVYLLLFLLFFGCSKQEPKKENAKGEFILRKHDQLAYQIPPPEPGYRENATWEKRYLGKYPQITKDFFRCKGNNLNPAIVKDRGDKEKIYFNDCGGADHHGLPLRDGKEFVYPCLIELLNYVQEKTGKRVHVTCGHRCPEHNAYCDYSKANFGSKHMIGAEVDFYVEGMERECGKIIALLQHYYKEKYKGKSDLENFSRFDKPCNVSTKPWFNKEIFIKYYRENEGRDADNNHPYPYIGLQVRFDTLLNEKVIFDEKMAKNFLRY